MANNFFKKVVVSNKQAASDKNVQNAVNKLSSAVSSDLNRIQANIESAFQLAQKNPLLQAIQFTDVAFTGIGPFTTVVNHGLGRVPIGWFVTDLLMYQQVYRSTWDSDSITLISDVNSIISIMVF